jgi:large subunit ribosomal protein L7/L12
MSETTEVKKEDVTADLSKESKSVIETIEKMSVLELSKLVKALEDKFGVVAAAPMAVAGAAPAGGGDADADAGASTVNVIITSVGDKKIQVLKAVRELTGLGLKEAKALVDTVPKAVKEDIEKDEAEKIKKQLEEQGATVEIK